VDDYDIAVIGGGIVGMAVAFGLVRRGRRVIVFDEGDRAFRASRGNFGLVWVQGKGDGLHDYAVWTRRSAALWPKLAADLRAETGVDVQLAQPGGLYICLDEDELAAQAATLAGIRRGFDGDYPFEVLDHRALADMVPAIGTAVAGATYCPEDGHVNPLRLLQALHDAFARRGGRLVNGVTVSAIDHHAGAITIATNLGSWTAGKVVLAAGLGNRRLAPLVGLAAPVAPNRGQVMISERVRPFLPYPTGHIRQTGEGSVQLGDSKEDVGFNDGTSIEVMSAIAHRAVATFPLLKGVRMVRAWGALRVMTGDGYPIYAESPSCPYAFVVTCHSGVTLAAAHAGPLAGWIAGGKVPFNPSVFNGDRFDVQAVA
jgi:glycine/D-amino acid oxidase-like deaminating enzyme